MEIDLDNLIYNYNEIKKTIGEDTDVIPIVKADAYGHGAVRIVKSLISEGAKLFGVAHLSEALHIKKYVPEAQVLVMGYTPDFLAEKAIDNDITLTVYLREQAELFSQTAKKLNKTLKIHIKLETGMNRLGFMPTEENIKNIVDIYNMDNIDVEGIFTHFPASDDDPDYTMKQVEKFDFVCNELEKENVNIRIKHISNSAAVMNFPDYYRDMVRAGVIIYGVYPFPDPDKNYLKLKSIMSLKSRISHLKYIEKGDKLSYGLTYEAKDKRQVATIPIGYADGFSRDLSNVGNCIVKNTLVPIIGRICMDQLIIDVTGLDVKRDDEVILIGSSQDESISLEDISGQIGQIPASLLCMFTKRLPRVYMKNNEILEVKDYLLDL